jgi:hypothetical protein
MYGTSAVEDNQGTPREGMARVGQILGIVGTVVWIVGVVWTRSLPGRP